MKPSPKWLFTTIALALALVGIATILSQQHTGYTRFHGILTVFGEEAVWKGKTCLLLAALPLTVWLPSHWVGPAIAVWWLSLMIWLFAPLLAR
jgi:diacylglycerol kinase